MSLRFLGIALSAGVFSVVLASCGDDGDMAGSTGVKPFGDASAGDASTADGSTHKPGLDGGDDSASASKDPCDSADCDAKATCSVEKGKAVCRCPGDYRDANGDGTLCTMDPTCDAMDCDTKAQCMVADGKAACVCPSGYADSNGDGSKCADVDECKKGTDDCDSHASCKNKAGGFTCTCDDGYAGNGVTCKEINECKKGTDNCDDNADCTNTAGSFECACKAGFSGDGLTCDDDNECDAATSPCDSHAECENTEGSYTCTCNKGYDGDGETCTPHNCEMTGTFAMLTEIDIAWDAVPSVPGQQDVISAGTDTTLGWSIRTQVQDGTTITTETVPCGSTITDFCGPYFDETYAQVIPNSVWDQPTMPTWLMTMTGQDTHTGHSFIGSTEIALLGLNLTDPGGTWPATYTDAAITWIDHDNDSKPGVSATMRATGNGPAKCASENYANLPISLTVRVTTIYSGSRTLGYVNGTILDCNTIKGDYSGPYTWSKGANTYTNMPQSEGHVVGCLTNQPGTNGGVCSTQQIADLDNGGAGKQQVTRSKFTLLRVADDITCAQVRAMDFTP
jgi:hypothetical protein